MQTFRAFWAVVIALALNSDNPSSNPAEVYSFSSVTCVFEKLNQQKEAHFDYISGGHMINQMAR